MLLLMALRNELGQRAKKEHAQLFHPTTIGKLSRTIERIANIPDALSKDSERRIMHDELMTVFRDAGTTACKGAHDSEGSLLAIRKVVDEINAAANAGTFGDHEITFKTNSIKTWLSRYIELVRAITDNRLE